MMLFYQLTYLRCHLSAIEAHHEQLAHGPVILSAKRGEAYVAILDTYHPMSSHIESFSILDGVKVSLMVAVDFFHSFGRDNRPACSPCLSGNCCATSVDYSPSFECRDAIKPQWKVCSIHMSLLFVLQQVHLASKISPRPFIWK